MADGSGGRTSSGVIVGFVLGAVVVGLALAGYLYYKHTHRDVVRINVPGFSGEISKDNGGVDINVGKDR